MLPTVPATIAATPSTALASSASSDGSLRSRSKAASATPLPGILTIRTGSPPSPAAAIATGSKPNTPSGEEPNHVLSTQRHHSRRRLRNTPLPSDAKRVETAPACLRQADDLLSAQRAHAGGHSRCANHLHAARHAALRAASRRRRPLGTQLPLRRAA